MIDYVFVYRAPKGCRGSPEGDTALEEWFESLGEHLLDKGNAVFSRAATGTAGPGPDTDTVLGGYSLITAENLDEAVELAKGFPLVAIGGVVEVGELIRVPGRHHLTAPTDNKLTSNCPQSV